MLRVIAVVNQKGGVGKTTTAVNLSAALAQGGQRVLMIDLDPQANATMGCGVDKDSLQTTVYHVLLGLTRVDRCIVPVGKSFDILPANRELAGAEVELVELSDRERRLRQALSQLSAHYDFALIDCPPALNLLTVNALCAAQRILIPMQCEYYALEGLSDLVRTLRRIKKSLNPNLEIDGLLRTMFDGRNMLAQQVSSQLVSHFREKVFKTVIPRNVRLAEAPSHGQNVFEFDRNCRGAKSYHTLSCEVLQRYGIVAPSAINPAQ